MMTRWYVSFYTGFTSYMVFCAFYEFLGPAVDHLNYWGAKEVQQQRRSRPRKLNPKNQLFLTLVKLRLNLKLKDLAFRFGVSPSVTSRYIPPGFALCTTISKKLTGCQL